MKLTPYLTKRKPRRRKKEEPPQNGQSVKIADLVSSALEGHTSDVMANKVLD